MEPETIVERLRDYSRTDIDQLMDEAAEIIQSYQRGCECGEVAETIWGRFDIGGEA